MIPILTLFVTLMLVLSAAQQIPARSIWFDASCSQKVRNTVWNEVGQMLTSGGLTLPTQESSALQLFNYIFHTKDNDKQQFIHGLLPVTEIPSKSAYTNQILRLPLS